MCVWRYKLSIKQAEARGRASVQQELNTLRREYYEFVDECHDYFTKNGY